MCQCKHPSQGSSAPDSEIETVHADVVLRGAESEVTQPWPRGQPLQTKNFILDPFVSDGLFSLVRTHHQEDG